MPIRVNISRESSDSEAAWFEYEDEPNLEILIAPLTPVLDEKCIDDAMLQPAQVNGRMRRQIAQPKFRHGLYKRIVFQRTTLGWRFKDPKNPALVDETGAPILYSEENKAAISEVHSGLVDFGFDIATALGQISADQVKEERARFRGVVALPDRPFEGKLPDVRDAVQPGGPSGDSV